MLNIPQTPAFDRHTYVCRRVAHLNKELKRSIDLQLSPPPHLKDFWLENFIKTQKANEECVKAELLELFNEVLAQ